MNLSKKDNKMKNTGNTPNLVIAESKEVIFY